MTCVRIPGGILTIADEVEPDPSWDLRTLDGREKEVLKQIRVYGGFDVFWATANRVRARAIDRLSEQKKIRRLEGARFPWCKYEIVEP